MIPGRYDIQIYRGSTVNLGITANNPDGTPINFNDYSLMRMQIRPPWIYTESVPRPGLLLELTTINNGLIINSDGFGFSINISARVTETLSFSEGQYDIELITTATPDNIVDKILRGRVEVIQEMTI